MSLFMASRPMPATLRRVDLTRRLVRHRHPRLGHRRFLVERDLGGRVRLPRRRLDRIGLVVVQRDRLLDRLRQLGLRLDRRRRRRRLVLGEQELGHRRRDHRRLRAIGLAHRQPGHQQKEDRARAEDALGDAPEADVVVARAAPGQNALAKRDAPGLARALALAVPGIVAGAVAHGHSTGFGHPPGPHGSNLWRTANETSL
jgi:hypothetical protein